MEDFEFVTGLQAQASKTEADTILLRLNKARRTVVLRTIVCVGAAIGGVVSFIVALAHGDAMQGAGQGFFFLIIAASSTPHEYYEEVRRAAHLHDIRLAPTLLKMQQSVQTQYARCIRKTLSELLPLMSTADLRAMDRGARKALVDSLSISHEVSDDRFLSTALTAIGKCGELRSEEAVIRFGAGCTNPDLQRAADECLEALKIGRSNSDASRSLLRAASSDEAPETLLRPATDREINPHIQELLHPEGP